MSSFASLRILRKSRDSRAFLTIAASSPIQYPYTPVSSSRSHPFLGHRSPCRFLAPLSKWVAPSQGPLFLTSPPSKLSQSATPLYLQGSGVVSRKVAALGLVCSAPRFPIEDGAPPPRLVDREQGKGEFGEDGFGGNFVNFPNMISMSRLASGPLLGWMITNEWYSYAFVGLAISGATDWLDGYVARKMRINSVVGSYLDPLADKVLIGCVALGMVHKGLLHPGLVGLVVLRDTLLVGGAVYLRANSMDWKSKNWYDFFNLDGTNPKKVEPLFISKVNTVFQLVLVAAALLQPELGTMETQTYISYLSWLVASTTVGSTAAYGAQYMRSRSVFITRNP